MKRVNSCTFALLVLLLTICSSCKKKDPVATEPEPSPTPVINTVDVVFITDSSAIAGGDLTAAGTSELESIGICIDTLPAPTTLKKLSIKSTSVGSFTLKVNGLKPNYKYYVRAYASHVNGTTYGNEVTFTTKSIWSKLDSSALDNYIVNCLEADGESIYAGTNDGVYFSPDTGQTWIKAGLSGQNVISLVTKEGMVFAAGHDFIERSADHGQNWSSALNNFPTILLSLGDMVVKGSTLLVSTHANVYASDDDGTSWHALANGLPANQFYNDLAVLDEVIYAAGGAISGNNNSLYSSEGNSTWANLATPAPLYSSKVLDLTATSSQLFFTTPVADGLYSSDDEGNTWKKINLLPSNVTYLYSKQQSLFCCTSVGTYYLSNDNGTTWSQISNKGITGVIPFSILLTDKYLFSATYDKGVFKRQR